jgi:chromosome segregation ATPase
VVADAEAQRERVLAQLGDEREALRAELQRLEAERDEMRDGLTRLRESLHRTISELPGGAPPPPPPPPLAGSQAQPPVEPS